MKYKFVVSLSILFITLTLVACTQSTTNISQSRPLKIGLMPDIGMFPLLVAQAEGFFSHQDLAVELIVFKSAKDRDAALQGGQIDGAMSDLLAVYFMNSNGIKVRATSVTESRFLLLANADGNINTLADLKNVEIGLSVNTVIEYVVDTMLAEEMVVPRKTSIPLVPVRMELLRTGQLQAAALPDPLATVLSRSGGRVLADSRDMALNPAVLIFTEKTLQNRSEAIKDLYIAYNHAVKAINETPEKYSYLLLEKGGFPEMPISDIEIPYFKDADIPEVEEVSRILRWVKAKGLEKGSFTYENLIQRGMF